jgi:hypothetical protein
MRWDLVHRVASRHTSRKARVSQASPSDYLADRAKHLLYNLSDNRNNQTNQLLIDYDPEAIVVLPGHDPKDERGNCNNPDPRS